MFRIKLVLTALITTFLTGNLYPVSLVNKVQAAGASLYLSPSSGTKYVGDRFNVSVYVATPQAANTFDVYLSTSNMTVTGISIGGSICILHPSPPSYNNVSGHFRCGLPTPGFTGQSGYIGYIAVRGNSSGTGRIFIDGNSAVLANDGAGTNILTSRGMATFNIQPQPTAAPAVSSTSHPDQDKWYKNKNASLSWSGNGKAFSWLLDQNHNTLPDQTSEGTTTSKVFENLGDGIWYFHVRVQGNNGTWSPASHYRLQVDTTPPEKFTPEADPKKNAQTRPIIAFNTTDNTSGVDHYKLKLDDGDWEIVANPYKLTKVTSGKHTVYVKAVDKAGNEQIGFVEITVKDITPPIIILPEDGSFLSYGSDLIIKGKSFAFFTVKIFLDGKEIATVKTDKDGNFEYIYKELLREGKHELYAVAVNPEEIESQPSELVHFQLDPKAYNFLGYTIPGLAIYTSIIILVCIFLLVIAFLLIGSRRFRKKLKSVLEELEEKVEEELIEEKVNKSVREAVEEEFEKAEEKIER